jgi:hypothetical protein
MPRLEGENEEYEPGAQPPLYSDCVEGQNTSIPDDSIIYVSSDDNSRPEGSVSNLSNKRRSVADWRRCVCTAFDLNYS